MSKYIFINYKLYPRGSGIRAVELTKKIAAVAADFPNVQVAVAPPILDIREVATAVDVAVWAQHCDPVDSVGEDSRGTGFVAPAGLKEDGAQGVFLNHSEHPFRSFDSLKKASHLCKKNGLSVLVFSPDVEFLEKSLSLNADFYAIEPPELIASKVTSISRSRPQTIERAAKIVPRGKLIVGAGIKSKDDVSIALQLGSCGVAVASDIVKAEEPAIEFRNLLEGFG
jgi:triosephosphate isomerase